MTQLLEKDGSLYAPFEAITDAVQRNFCSNNGKEGRDPILMLEYPSGDVDTIKWPNFNADNLRSALYDAREMGLIPDEPAVLLPDGTEFEIE